MATLADSSPRTDGISEGNSNTRLPSFNLKSFVVDETYEKLKKSFISEGKGRRPSPPSVLLTNRVLLQLRAVQHESGSTCNDVGRWITTLFPDVAYPVSRLSGLLNRAEKKLKEVFETGGDLQAYLDIQLELDFVSSVLSDLGLKYDHLMSGQLPSGFTPKPISNEVIVDLEKFRTYRERKTDRFTLDWIKKLSPSADSDTDLRRGLKQVMKQYSNAKKLKDRPDMLSLFLNMIFSVPPRAAKKDNTSIPSSSEPTPSTSGPSAEKAYSKLSKEKARLSEETGQLRQHVSVLTDTVNDLSKDKEELRAQVSEFDKLREQANIMCAELAEKKRFIHNTPKKVKRLRTTVKKLKDELRAEKERGKRQGDAKATIKTLTGKLAMHQCNLLRTKGNLMDKIHRLREENRGLQQQVEELTQELNAAHIFNRSQDFKVGNNRYNDNMRRTVMELMGDACVSGEQCSKVMQIVAKHLFDTDLPSDCLPCPATCCSIFKEGRVISVYQSSEKILQSTNITLHTDGTSRGGHKIIGQQVTLDSGETLSLGFTTVAKEDADTLLDVSIQLLEELADVFTTEDSEVDKEETYTALLSKITSTMSDRAAVMKSMDKKLQQYLCSTLDQEISVHFLKCNAHFLLGLSRACETALKSIEKDIKTEQQTGLGRDRMDKFKRFNSAETATSRVIRLVSDLTGPRGDEKNGCRSEWMAFCDEIQTHSKMTCYRSNRFNCYFQTAAAIIHHVEDLRKFFGDGYLAHSNLKMESVAADLSDPGLLVLVCSVALVYICIAGPFWNLLESDTKYSKQYIYIQKLEACIDRWREDASDILDEHFPGIFDGQFQVETPMKTAVFRFSAEHSPEVKSTLELIMRDLLLVTRGQLCDFLPGGVYSGVQPPDVADALDHCPLTNLLGENVFGELDFQMNKSRNASFYHRSTTQMLRHNRTSSWLSTKSDDEIVKIMALARKRNVALRLHHKRQEELVKLKIRERLLENLSQKRKKAADLAAKKADIIRKVVGHGGPCHSHTDVAHLIRRLKSQKTSKAKVKCALQNEIRYQKLVLNSKGSLKVGGTCHDLTSALENHLRTRPTVLGADLQPPAVAEEETAAAQHVAGHPDDGQPPPPQRVHTETESDENGAPFKFSRQGEWVAVFYDEQFYVGQVLEVKDEDSGLVQFLEKTKGRDDYFRWPRIEDVAEVRAFFVFRWSLDVLPVSSDGRVWQVLEIEDVVEAYGRISVSN